MWATCAVSSSRRARGFLDRLALLDNQDSKDEAPEDKVNLTTVHAAKGLEFDVVVCVGLEDGLFPHQRAIDERRATGKVVLDVRAG